MMQNRKEVSFFLNASVRNQTAHLPQACDQRRNEKESASDFFA